LELVGSHLRGDRFYGKVVSTRRPILTVRSEIGPYRRPITAVSGVAKNNHRRHSDEKFLSPKSRPIIDRLNPDFKIGKSEIAEIAEHITRFSLAAIAELTRQARRS
jgi:hypothetical protein